MLENDGKNVLHLLNWAHLKRYVYELIKLRTHVSPSAIEDDATIYALTLWLTWMTSSRGEVIVLKYYDCVFDILFDPQKHSKRRIPRSQGKYLVFYILC